MSIPVARGSRNSVRTSQVPRGGDQSSEGELREVQPGLPDVHREKPDETGRRGRRVRPYTHPAAALPAAYLRLAQGAESSVLRDFR